MLDNPSTSKVHRHRANEPERQALLSSRVASLRLPDDAVGRKSPRRWVVWLGVLAAFGGAGFFGYKAIRGATPPDASPPAATAASSASSPTVSLPAPAIPGRDEIALEAKGYIIPARQILISPQVNGRILRLPILEGLRVKRDQILAELEDTEYKTERDRVKGVLEAAQRRLEELETGNRPEEISEARAELAETQAQLKQLESEYERNKVLWKKKVVTDEEYIASESKFRSTEHHAARLKYALKLMEDGPRIERKQAARAEVQQAQADLAKAEWRLNNCTIRAPISGTILKKNAEEGNIVNPVAMNGSFSLCEMADLADLEVDLSIQERDVARIFQGQKCKVCAEAFPDRTYQGTVSRLMPIADRAKGAVPVRVKVVVPAEEEGVYLKPEMGAIVTFYGAPPTARQTKSHGSN